MKPDLYEAGAYRPVLRDGARWVLEKRLGCGGTSVVWQARDPKTGDRVALKVLEGPSAESLAQRSFGKEVAMATRLDHPGILRVFGMSCDDAGRPLVEMELAEGGSLATKALRQGGCLSWEELRPLALRKRSTGGLKQPGALVAYTPVHAFSRIRAVRRSGQAP